MAFSLVTHYQSRVAYYTGGTNWAALSEKPTPNFMCNQQVTYEPPKPGESTGTWNYTPLKYWPAQRNDKISFFAYAPYGINDANGFLLPKENPKDIHPLPFIIQQT